MSLLFVQPGHPMVVGPRQPALYAPLPSVANLATSLTQVVSRLAACWNASQPGGLLGPSNMRLSTWSVAAGALRDTSGNDRHLLPFSVQSPIGQPQGAAHLSGLL